MRRWFDRWRNSRTAGAEGLELDRVELADAAGGPAEMAAAVHRQLGPLSGAIPIEEIARAVDIIEIRKQELDGFEGMLITDRRRNSGKILVNTRGGTHRARFSIAHELGHFLLENHELSDALGFVCDGKDMRERRTATQHQRQEREANRFAIDLLAPAYRLKALLAAEPDLRSALQMRQELRISFEASVQRYVELHDEPLAAIVVQGHAVRYTVRNARFPWLKLKQGDRIPHPTRAHRVISAGKPGVTTFAETPPAAWIENTDIEIFEQTHLGRDGFAITLLWASISDPDVDESGVEELTEPRFRGRRDP